MCADGAGEISATGPAVTRVKVGNKIAAAMFPRSIDGPIAWEYAPQLGGFLDGMLAEYVVLSEDAVVHIPEHLSFEEASTLPCAAVTAWNALVGGRKLQARDSVLTLGSGGVSLFALHLSKLFGARVIATTSSDEKADPARGDPNAPESSSAFVLDLTNPVAPTFVKTIKTGPLVGQVEDGIKTVGGSHPIIIAVGPKAIFVANGNNNSISILDKRTYSKQIVGR
jgi:threonine dehydrogenase-like Zn-dependent dehydrogenase